MGGRRTVSGEGLAVSVEEVLETGRVPVVIDAGLVVVPVVASEALVVGVKSPLKASVDVVGVTANLPGAGDVAALGGALDETDRREGALQSGAVDASGHQASKVINACVVSPDTSPAAVVGHGVDGLQRDEDHSQSRQNSHGVWWSIAKTMKKWVPLLFFFRRHETRTKKKKKKRREAKKATEPMVLEPVPYLGTNARIGPEFSSSSTFVSLFACVFFFLIALVKVGVGVIRGERRGGGGGVSAV